MCRVLKVSSSGYYDSVTRQASAHQIRRIAIAPAYSALNSQMRRLVLPNIKEQKGAIDDEIVETFIEGIKGQSGNSKNSGRRFYKSA